ncbi:GlxA family transcriptional regulator [Sporichthya polymorpha]|uniref:GlxA family transcriptional regulator n=1 Tax=Sporichthya polymorpha TaxID=35751 RepID=UPI00036B3BC8|nr:helix-turn-helix domain-containing protein [Sporichthya polymorpha]
MARRMLLVAHPGALGMELLGVRDILEMANAVVTARGEAAPYQVEVASSDGEPVELWGGLTLSGVRNLAGYRAAVDTLIVLGGPVAADAAAADATLVDGIRRVASRARRVVGICTGAFLLAECGLLDGRRATTHWLYGDSLAERHPAIEVDTEPIFVTDDCVWTSAGVTSGFDLVLALVEADVGVDVARKCAQMMVLYLRRSGTQAQFSAAMTASRSAQRAQRAPVAEIQAYIHDHPTADLSLAALADRVHMSPRHFTRVFTAEVGVSPGRYVERVRLETARALLAESDDSTEAVARAAGFGNYQAMRRAFVSSLGVSPAEYRRRFGAAPDLTIAV